MYFLSICPQILNVIENKLNTFIILKEALKWNIPVFFDPTADDYILIVLENGNLCVCHAILDETN
ncbi:hypothetical protein D3C74_66730 [compost metagenome]